MIGEAKREIILSEGVPVDVLDYTGAVLFSTNALVGKATKQFFSEISLEYHRTAQFVPELDIRNGLIVNNKVTNEFYLVMAHLKEVVGSEHIATVTRLVECNARVRISSFGETADDDGNITKTEIVKADNLCVYVEKVRADLKQFKPGLYENVEYNIYAPAISNVSVLDRVVLDMNGVSVPFKIESVDYTTFVGVMILGVCTETRS